MSPAGHSGAAPKCRAGAMWWRHQRYCEVFPKRQGQSLVRRMTLEQTVHRVADIAVTSPVCLHTHKLGSFIWLK